jgi:hypothetical protein
MRFKRADQFENHMCHTKRGNRYARHPATECQNGYPYTF